MQTQQSTEDGVLLSIQDKPKKSLYGTKKLYYLEPHHCYWLKTFFWTSNIWHKINNQLELCRKIHIEPGYLLDWSKKNKKLTAYRIWLTSVYGLV